jgi:hypothetical protein
MSAQELADFARRTAKNPGSIVTPVAELERIRSKMGTPEYLSNEPMQARYRELLRLTSRAN